MNLSKGTRVENRRANALAGVIKVLLSLWTLSGPDQLSISWLPAMLLVVDEDDVALTLLLRGLARCHASKLPSEAQGAPRLPQLTLLSSLQTQLQQTSDPLRARRLPGGWVQRIL